MSASGRKIIWLLIPPSYVQTVFGITFQTPRSVAVGASTPRQASELMIRKARERAGGHGDNVSFAIVKLSPRQSNKDLCRGKDDMVI